MRLIAVPFTVKRGSMSLMEIRFTVILDPATPIPAHESVANMTKLDGEMAGSRQKDAPFRIGREASYSVRSQ